MSCKGWQCNKSLEIVGSGHGTTGTSLEFLPRRREPSSTWLKMQMFQLMQLTSTHTCDRRNTKVEKNLIWINKNPQADSPTFDQMLPHATTKIQEFRTIPAIQFHPLYHSHRHLTCHDCQFLRPQALPWRPLPPPTRPPKQRYRPAPVRMGLQWWFFLPEEIPGLVLYMYI